MTGPTAFFDAPRRYIGAPERRRDADRLARGRGRFVDDLALPRMLHAAFVRSPHAHARIAGIDAEEARAMPGVRAVLTAADLEGRVTPYVGTLSHLAGLRSPPQHPLAVDVARWQGEPVALVVAESRALAEDAAERVEVDYDPLPAACDLERALEPGAPVIHEGFGSNLAWERLVEAGDVDAAMARAHTVVERSFRFGRHTGVTLEARTALFEPGADEGTLTLHYSGQAPHMMQSVLARHLGLAEADVRVASRDVGGSFGVKIHLYGDEVAAAAAALMLGRPVKFVADRQESFLSDIHARDHVVHARLGVSAEGAIEALEIDDLTGIGPYSMYPRTSAIECNQVLNLTGAPYRVEHYRARGRVAFQNKAQMCQYRAVGHPIAMAVADGLLEQAAREIGLDAAEIRRRNLIPDDAHPSASASGMRFDDLSHQKTLSRLLEVMDMDALRADQREARDRGVHRGIGLCTMVEVTNPSPLFYGVGGAPIAAQDGATVRLDASGALHVSASVTEQGQGTDAVLAQIAADAMGMDLDRVRVETGDTAHAPYGGGTWASRGTGIGGEAALRAAMALKEQVLGVAGALLQADPASLDVRGGQVVDAGGARMDLADLARTVYFRGHELPRGLATELIATRHAKVEDVPFVFTNGAMAARVEVDTDTGFVRVLGFWAVEDCGRVVNPMLVDEQIRGGVVQGIGGALFEECLYDEDGQLLTVTMADYLVPMAAEMPDIVVDHVETPTRTSLLGAKGAGEAGTGGAPAAVLNAVNDALAPLGASLWQMPMTPERVLRALGRI